MTPPGTFFTALLYGILPIHRPDLRYVHIYAHGPADVMITMGTVPLGQDPSYQRVMYTMLAPLLESAVPHWPLVLSRFNLIGLTFFDWIRLTVFDSI